MIPLFSAIGFYSFIINIHNIIILLLILELCNIYIHIILLSFWNNYYLNSIYKINYFLFNFNVSLLLITLVIDLIILTNYSFFNSVAFIFYTIVYFIISKILLLNLKKLNSNYVFNLFLLFIKIFLANYFYNNFNIILLLYFEIIFLF